MEGRGQAPDRPLRVLVAEDEPGTRLLVAAAATRLGHECLLAADGDEAWAMCLHKQPDAVITDWDMPGLDGAELTRRLRADPDAPYTYVIVLTGRAGEVSARATMRAGADSLLLKPLETSELERCLIAAGRVTDMDRQRRRAEDALRRREQQYRSVVDNVTDVVFQTDPRGALTFLNPAWETITGHRSADSLGRTLRSFLVDPDDLPGGVAGAIGLDGVDRRELRLRTRDGGSRWVELLARDTRVGGTAVGSSGTLTDVTLRRRRRERLKLEHEVTRVLAEAASPEDAIAGVLAVVGPAVGAVHGAYWKTAAAGEARSCIARWPEDSAAPGGGTRFAFPVVGGERVLGTCEFESAAAGVVPDSDLLAALETFGRRVGGFIARKDAERRAREMQDEFLALVSHELRTPLTSIAGYVELLRETESDEDRLSAFEVIERNTRRLERLVGDVLLVAQADASTLILSRSRVDLGAIVAASAQAAEPSAAREGVELVAPAGPAVHLDGDPDRLGQAIDNLLANAIKFTPSGGRVEVRLTSDGERACVEIRDTGIGIPDEEQHRLFERFFRAKAATDRAIQGVGLGLTIVKAIVRSHGGKLTFTSAQGVGSAFAISLPLLPAA